jgi:hypothetical protein
LLTACGGEPTPEERVQVYIDKVTASAEARKWRSFEDYVADEYADDRGLSKKDVLAVVARYILGNKQIHILERTAAIRIDNPRHAHAVVYAAMAGQPISGAGDLAHITADVYRFDVDLAASEDGVFRVIRGEWKPVSPEQFLIGR